MTESKKTETDISKISSMRIIRAIHEFVNLVFDTVKNIRDILSLQKKILAYNVSHNTHLENIQQLEQQLLEAIKSLYQRQECLERASQQQELLSRQHYDQHIIEPMARSFLPIADIIEQARKSYTDIEFIPKDDVMGLFQAIETHFIQYLSNYDIKLFRSRQGSKFNPKYMQPIRMVLTDQQEKDQTVEKSLQPGLRHDDRVLRYESVAIYRFDKQPNNPKILVED